MAVDSRILRFIPHAGSMCLLERIIRWDDDEVLVSTTSHASNANPLATADGLRAVYLCEYGAQAMAVHGGLTASDEGKKAVVGMLVSLREIELHCAYVHDLAGEILITARRLHLNERALSYRFFVTHAGRGLAQGRALVSTGK